MTDDKEFEETLGVVRIDGTAPEVEPQRHSLFHKPYTYC